MGDLATHNYTSNIFFESNYTSNIAREQEQPLEFPRYNGKGQG
jgi:hypothetical protein